MNRIIIHFQKYFKIIKKLKLKFSFLKVIQTKVQTMNFKNYEMKKINEQNRTYNYSDIQHIKLKKKKKTFVYV